MRTATLLLGASLPAVLVAGCVFHFQDDCIEAHDCPPSTSASDGGPDSGDAGEGGNVNCDPTAGAVDASCGVFVSASAAPSGTGTMTSPYNTLQAAIDNAAGKYVYACASAAFSEAVTISIPVQLYGGFADCGSSTGWTWSQSARSHLNGAADTVALTITASAAGTKVEGFAITAPSPSSMTMGGSSIAVAVADVAATLEQCDVTAGDAADGSAGQPLTGTATRGTDASAPIAQTENACSLPGAVAGGAPGVTMCGGIDTSGGVGGKGGIPVTSADGGSADSAGQQGVNGSPLPNPNPTMAGVGGIGQADPTDPTKVCKRGQDGLAGSAGGDGPGGAASGAGDMLSLSGVVNNDVTDGQPGTPGQGGGGGGGAMSGTFCGSSASPIDGPGASGGGGGAGGCAGAGGGGGKAGGSSIAIVTLGTSLTLTSVTRCLWEWCKRWRKLRPCRLKRRMSGR
jgi:hypothetical protein